MYSINSRLLEVLLFFIFRNKSGLYPLTESLCNNIYKGNIRRIHENGFILMADFIDGFFSFKIVEIRIGSIFLIVSFDEMFWHCKVGSTKYNNPTVCIFLKNNLIFFQINESIAESILYCKSDNMIEWYSHFFWEFQKVFRSAKIFLYWIRCLKRMRRCGELIFFHSWECL